MYVDSIRDHPNILLDLSNIKAGSVNNSKSAISHDGNQNMILQQMNSMKAMSNISFRPKSSFNKSDHRISSDEPSRQETFPDTTVLNNIDSFTESPIKGPGRADSTNINLTSSIADLLQNIPSPSVSKIPDTEDMNIKSTEESNLDIFKTPEKKSLFAPESDANMGRTITPNKSFEMNNSANDSRQMNVSRDSGSKPLSSSLKKRSGGGSDRSSKNVSFGDDTPDNEWKNKSVKKVPRTEPVDDFMRTIARNILQAKKKRQMSRERSSKSIIGGVAENVISRNQSVGDNAAKNLPKSASGNLNNESGSKSNISDRKSGHRTPPLGPSSSRKKVQSYKDLLASKKSESIKNEQKSVTKDNNTEKSQDNNVPKNTPNQPPVENKPASTGLQMIGGSLMKVMMRKLPDGTLQKV